MTIGPYRCPRTEKKGNIHHSQVEQDFAVIKACTKDLSQNQVKSTLGTMGQVLDRQFRRLERRKCPRPPTRM